MNNIRVALLPIVPLLFWVSGCATQTDLQAEQRARESLRSQIVADSRSSLDDLRREVQKVRGEMEELRHRLDRTAKERVGTGPQIKLLDDRLAVLEKQFKARLEAPPPPPVSMYPPSATPYRMPDGSPGQPPAEAGSNPSEGPVLPATSALPGPVAGTKEAFALAKEPLDVQDEYKIGWQAAQDRHYDKAVQQFRAFQRKYPSSEMSDDAQYWIGESYFSQKDYNRAILEFNDVLKYRKGDRVPAALLRQAQAFIEIGDKTDARLILQKLLNDHPSSEQAPDARKLLTGVR
ncbi:MAG: tol-pal system protein YbgF [Deltaproteobacteria bacterium]|nr:tol-pal system protein YbgF [Deltaproteobacteria bacterium]